MALYSAKTIILDGSDSIYSQFNRNFVGCLLRRYHVASLSI